ncbi:MAG TPA: hypothetical protein EYN64_03945, partial [Flavobacteriales bacterium]|nr:hypothetical protein [Flavobacteriales bacterium]
MLLRFFFAISFSICSFAALYAQSEANIWYFGSLAGVDFNSGNPVALTNGQLSTSEGCASICDANGNLLFYSDGSTVYDASHSIMQNGTGLMGHPSSAQSGIIVPKPGSTDIYYLCTVNYNLNPAIGLRYSEIDLSLNGGLGAVTVNKNVYLGGPACEKLCVIKHGNNVDYWVIFKKTGTNQFNCFLITCAGVSLIPVQSNVGYVTQSWGYMTGSPDGKRLAVAERYLGFEVYEIDNTTGIVSNPISLGNGSEAYGLTFSLDNNLLYGLRINDGAIFQWNLQAGNIGAIQASRINVGTASGTGTSYLGGAMQIAPDGKIYIPDYQWPSLSVIQNPNVVGAGCNYMVSVVNLQGRNAILGLPPFVSGFFSPDFTWQNTCEFNLTQFGIEGDTTVMDSVKWIFGDPLSGSNVSSQFHPKHQFSQAGQFQVQFILYVSCAVDTSTDTVTISPVITFNRDVEICDGQSYFVAGQLQTTAGMYYDTLSSQHACDSVVATNLIVQPNYVDTLIYSPVCQGDTIFFLDIVITISGIYDTVLQTVSSCDSLLVFPIVFLPNFDFFDTVEICDGQGYFVGGQMQTISGVYVDSLTTIVGCDSIFETQLIVHTTYADTFQYAICPGDSLFVGGLWQITPGIYFDSLLTVHGCDSVIVSDLQVQLIYQFPVSTDICDDDSFFVGGAWQFSTGIYYDTLFTIYNCDSVIETSLTVGPTYFNLVDTTICQFVSFYTGMQWISVTGTYTDNYLTTNGCDSMIQTNLVVKTWSYTVIDTAICEGEAYFTAGQLQTTSGTYFDTLVAFNQCDSVITTNLTVKPIHYDSLTFHFCQGDSVFANGQWQLATGIFVDTLLSSLNCDSVLTTFLFVHPHKVTDISAGICNGDAYFADGQWQYNAGTYYDSLATTFGCDSVVQTYLTVIPVFTLQIDTTVCIGNSVWAGGQLQFETGNYIDSLLTVSNCDSIILTNLSINNPVVDLGPDTSICENESILLDAGSFVGYEWYDGSVLSQTTIEEPGVYWVRVVSEFGCEAMDTLAAVHLCPYSLYVPNVFSPN